MERTPRKKGRVRAVAEHAPPRALRGRVPRSKEYRRFLDAHYASLPRDAAASTPTRGDAALADFLAGLDQPFTETKKVRLGARTAKWLAQTARREGRNESELIREGLLLVERVRARGASLEGMLEFVDDDADERGTFELR